MSDLELLSPRTLLAVIDMQRLFAEETAWYTPTLREIVPAVVRLASARPGPIGRYSRASPSRRTPRRLPDGGAPTIGAGRA